MSSGNESGSGEARPTMDAIEIPRGVRDELFDHMIRSLPLEGCGLIAFHRRLARPTAVKFFAGRNIDRSATRFTMDPRDVLDALQEIDRRGWELGAIVHSHPKSLPTLSLVDLAEARYPGVLLGIAGMSPPPPTLRFWSVSRGEGRKPEEVKWRLSRRRPAFPDNRVVYDGTLMGGFRPPGPTGQPSMINVERQAERKLVDALEAFPGELRRLLDVYPTAALQRPASDGGWGVVENLCHLRDWERVFLDRVRAIAAHDRPTLPAFDDGLWEIERGYRVQDPERVLCEFADLRREMVDLLRGLDADGWQREGVHVLLGPVGLRWLAEYLSDHDRGHWEQIGHSLN